MNIDMNMISPKIMFTPVESGRGGLGWRVMSRSYSGHTWELLGVNGLKDLRENFMETYLGKYGMFALCD